MERATELNRELVEMAAENDEALMELYFERGRSRRTTSVRDSKSVSRGVKSCLCSAPAASATSERNASWSSSSTSLRDRSKRPNSSLDRGRGDRRRRDAAGRGVRLQEPDRTPHRRDQLPARDPRQTHRRHGAAQHPHGQQGEGFAALRRGGQKPHQSDRTGGRRHRLHGQVERHAHQRHARGTLRTRDDHP